MLSPSHDDDDDTHLCIKCNATIIGLEQYIKHRKERCGKKYDSIIKTPKADTMPTLDPFELTYSLGADLFFQSLELQSSVKKTPLSRLSPPPVPKNLDRKETLSTPTSSRDITRISPLESNLRGEDWIGGHSLRIGFHDDNQTNLINAVANISGTAKKDIPSASYNLPAYHDYKGDEESEDASDETDDEDDEDNIGGGKWKPPIDHTGGKWRPASPDHEDWEEEHTGGKWKPIMPTVERDEDYDDAPPPEHTKGKWIPGAQEKTQIMEPAIHTKTSVQYWCGPCNRRLASRAIYEKHLVSNLHIKKVLPEHDLEYAGHMNPPRTLTQKRTSRPSQFLDDTIYQPPKKKQKCTDVTKYAETAIAKRKRKRLYELCPGCNSRVRSHLMGKHLISHYHFRKATDVLSDTYQKLVLDNIGCIVRQSPFQCSPCKFYTNWQINFMEHWLSSEHDIVTSKFPGKFWCSFCKFDCDSSFEMYEHMSSSDHTEVVAVINRSMPIIIRKKFIMKCSDYRCEEEFRFNVEAKKHARKTGHSLPLTATDIYQEIHECEICQERFRSSLNLAAHLKSRHKQRAFFCLVCAKSFTSSQDARRHRQTTEHRIRRKEKLRDKGVPIKDLSRKCPYCVDLVLKNVLELKDHIHLSHPELRKSCSKCGMTFALSQEVTHHVKSNACQFLIPNLQNESVLWNCSQCLFNTKSQAECFYHEALHTEPLKCLGKRIKYTCPLCPKSFTKHSLRHHLRQHTFERPFECNVCHANFTRPGSLANHLKVAHKNEQITKDDVNLQCGKCDKTFGNSCSKCGMTFALSQEVTRHVKSNACQFLIPNLQNESVLWNCSQCLFNTKSQAECFYHEALHTEPLKCLGKRIKYTCPLCPKSFTKPSLRHHVRQHTFERPFECNVCHANFTRPDSLANHLKVAHKNEQITKDDVNLQCGKCNKTFGNSTYLTRHIPKCGKERKELVRDKKCFYEGCNFVGTSRSQLFRHRKSSHGDHTKLHQCKLCSYKTNQISHMKQHIISHEGLRPYKCPHCEYTCGSLENLRKHTFRKNTHPGKFLYTCKDCSEIPFQTNMATLLRKHLIEDHIGKYDRETAVAIVKNYLRNKFCK